MDQGSHDHVREWPTHTHFNLREPTCCVASKISIARAYTAGITSRQARGSFATSSSP